MARNEHVVLRSATIACLVVVYMQVMVYGMGGVINLGKPDIEPPESATIWASITSGLPNSKTKKADPQRESAFNSGSGGTSIEKLKLYAEPFPLVSQTLTGQNSKRHF